MAMRINTQQARIAILRDGVLVQQGKPVDILLNPADDYVEAFVKDVNRARALTVETVMKPQIVRISAQTIGDAVNQMRQVKEDYGYYVTDEGYQGVITQESLDEISESQYHQAIPDSLVESVPAVTTDALLESVIPETLDSDHPLPVIDELGEVKGRLSRSTLAEILSDQTDSNKAEVTQNETIKKSQTETKAA